MSSSKVQIGDRRTQRGVFSSGNGEFGYAGLDFLFSLFSVVFYAGLEFIGSELTPQRKKSEPKDDICKIGFGRAKNEPSKIVLFQFLIPNIFV